MANEIQRVLHVGLSKSFGGIAAYQMNLYKNLDREKVQLDFVTHFDKPAAESLATSMGSRIFYLPPEKKIYSYIKEFRQVIIENNYKIVHIHKNSAANILPFLICKQCKVPFIIAHAHSTNAIDSKLANIPHFFSRKLLKRLISKGFACSAAAAGWMYGKNYKNDKRVEIVQNGIDIHAFEFDNEIRIATRKFLGIEDHLVLGHVGNFIRPKNHRFILDIFKEVLKKRPDARLLLIGTGGLMESIVRYSKKIGVSKSVIFAGNKSNVNIYYQAMDIYLMPSIHEGLPFAGVEAQAAGLPCFFSDAITKELAITRLARFLRLDLGSAKWAEEIVKINISKPREKFTKELSAAGYDASLNAKRLEEYYLESMGKVW